MDAEKIASGRRRIFKERLLQDTYDGLRVARPDPEKVRGMAGDGNAYAVGYTRSDVPNRIFPRGSKAYAAWAAGVDNARQDARRILADQVASAKEAG